MPPASPICREGARRRARRKFERRQRVRRAPRRGSLVLAAAAAGGQAGLCGAEGFGRRREAPERRRVRAVRHHFIGADVGDAGARKRREVSPRRVVEQRCARQRVAAALRARDARRPDPVAPGSAVEVEEAAAAKRRERAAGDGGGHRLRDLAVPQRRRRRVRLGPLQQAVGARLGCARRRSRHRATRGRRSDAATARRRAGAARTSRIRRVHRPKIYDPSGDI